MSDHDIYLQHHDDSKRAWQAGMSYDGLHIYYAAPMHNCECDACDRGRLWERAEEKLWDENDDYYRWQEERWKKILA